MIPFCSLFRVDRGIFYCLQGRCSSHSLRFGKSMNATKDRVGGGVERKMKRKIDLRVWRPLSTQAASFEENVSVVGEDGGKVHEVHGSISNSIPISQGGVKVAEAVSEVTDSTITPSADDQDFQDGALVGASTISAEKHSLSIQVGTSLFRFIKGKSESTQRKIEEEMGVQIIFPSSKKVESITIEGFSVDSVTKASEKIQAIIDEAVKSPNLNYSHFISLPLAIHPALVDKLVNFQNSILGKNSTSLDENLESNSNEDASDHEDNDQKSNEGLDVAVELKVEDNRQVRVGLTSLPLVSYAPKASKSPALYDLGIDKSIFIKPKTFHLTLLMLKLWNKERVNAASEVLKSVSSKVVDALDNRPISIRLKGLNSMRGSIAKARVLYTTVEEIGNEDRLLRACQVITDAFVEAGLVLEKDAKQKLKLHATVMNASHRKGKKKRGKYDSFDARDIFEQFGSEEWGEYVIREAHLSQRFVFDDNGYYHCCASIPFPDSVQVVD